MSHFRLPLIAAGAALALSLGGCARARHALGVGGAPGSSPARVKMAPRNGLEVIGAMRRAHPSRSLRSIAFTMVPVATPERRGSEGPTRAVASLPGRFRMTALPASRRTGSVRNQGRLAIFERGRRVVTRERVDLATLLAYDLFAQGIDTTIRWLGVAQVRYAIARRDRLEGRPVWVVGAPAGDSASPQFWVDEDSWRVVRVIQPDPESPTRRSDVRFPEHTVVLDVPLPTRVELYRGGVLVERHTISNVVVNPAIPSSAFDLSRWRDIRVGN